MTTSRLPRRYGIILLVLWLQPLVTARTLTLNETCRPLGSSSAWVKLNGDPVPCDFAPALSHEETLVPDVGGYVLVSFPMWVHIDNRSSLSCVLEGTQLATTIRADPLITNIPAEERPFSQPKFAALCLLPTFLNTSREQVFNITPSVDGDRLNGSFPIRIFGISNFVSPIVTFSEGQARFTINVYNFLTLNKHQKLAPSCRFRLQATSNQSLPWYQTSAMRDPSREYLIRATLEGDQLFCSGPPLPPKINMYRLALSVSADITTTGWSGESYVDLVSIQGQKLSVDRSFLQGSVPLTISGAYFPYDAYKDSVYMPLVRVRLGHVDTSGTILSSTSMTCTVPANSAGTYPVEISLDGQSFASLNFTFDYFPTPSVSSITPTKVLEHGTLILVTGSGFPPNSLLSGVACKFEGQTSFLQAATFISSTRLRCYSPKLTLTSSYQDYSMVLSFDSESNLLAGSLLVKIFRVPEISTVYPTILSVVGGATLTVTGSNFVQTDQLACNFGTGQLVAVTLLSQSLLQCKSPSLAYSSPSLSVSVTLNGEDFSNSIPIAIYIIESLFPTAASSLGGSRISIKLNSNFSLNQTSYPDTFCSGAACIDCNFFNSFATVQTFYGSVSINATRPFNQILCKTPPVSNQALLYSFTLSLNHQIDFTPSRPFLIFQDPVFYYVKPCLGPVTGGTKVTIFGDYFYQVESDTSSPLSQCLFGGLQGVAYLNDCYTSNQLVSTLCRQIVCVSPPISSGVATTSTTVGNNDAVLVADLKTSFTGFELFDAGKFRYYNIPVVSSTTPSTCPNVGGTTITVQGSNLQSGYNDTLLCRFWPKNATNSDKIFLDPYNYPPDQSVMTTRAYMDSNFNFLCPCPRNTRLEIFAVEFTVSLNAQQFTSNGPKFVLHQPVELYATTPLSGNQEGSTFMFLLGNYFVAGPGLQAFFDNSYVAATFVRQDLVTTATPVKPIGYVTVRVSNNGGVDKSSSSTSYFFFSSGWGCPSDVETGACSWGGRQYGSCLKNSCNCTSGYWGRACSLIPKIGRIFPAFGPPQGGIVVSLFGVFLAGECCNTAPAYVNVPTPLTPRSGSFLLVRISGTSTTFPAMYNVTVNALYFSCPAGTIGSVLYLEASFDAGASFFPAPGYFSFEAEPLVTKIAPTLIRSAGYSLVSIYGQNFHPRFTMRCKYGGSDSMPAVYMSSSFAICSTPAYNVSGYAAVAMTTNGQDYVTSTVNVFVYDELSPFSITPTFGSITGGTLVTVQGGPNLLVDAVSVCSFGDLLSAMKVVGTDVVCQSPAFPVAGSVSFKIALDGINFACYPQASNELCKFTYFSELGITSIFPNVSSVQGGTTIQVYGYGFLAFSSARCFFGQASTSFTVTSATQGSCESPAVQSPQKVSFSVTINGRDQVYYSSTFQLYNLSVLHALVPPGSPVQGGSSLTIQGDFFSEFAGFENVVKFGNVSLPLVRASRISSSIISCIIPPAQAAGLLHVQVALNGYSMAGRYDVAGDEWSNELSFLSYVQPDILSIWPWAVSTRGSDVITVAVSSTYVVRDFARCRFLIEFATSKTAEATILSSSTMACRSPATTSPARASVEISMNSLDFTLSRIFVLQLLDPPAVVSFLPSSSFSFGSTEFEVSAANFVDTQWASCVFNGNGTSTAALALVNSTSGACSAPPTLGEGLYNVSVSLTSSNEIISHTLAVTSADILDFQPRDGLICGNTLVNITGFGFIDNNITCHFGFRTSTATFVNSSIIQCLSPPAPVPFLIQVPFLVYIGSSSLHSQVAQIYSFDAPPVILDFSPKVGIEDGGTRLVIVGLNLRETQRLSCKFGSKVVPGSMVEGSDNSMSCTAPSSPVGFVDLWVSLNAEPGEFFAARSRFYFYSHPQATSFGPSAGPYDGGTVVTMDFVFLPYSTTMSCKFGNIQVKADWETYQSAICSSPPYKVDQSLSVQFSLNGQEFFSWPFFAFRWVNMPFVNLVIPTSGPSQSGSPVTVYGMYFFSTSAVSCKVGNQTSPATVLSSTVALCQALPIRDKNVSNQASDFVQWEKLPATVLLSSHLGLNMVKFAVDGQHFSVNGTGNFSYYPSPSVWSIDPKQALTSSPWVTVTLTGSDFLLSQEANCRFGDVVVAGTVHSATRMTCSAPPVAKGLGVLVEVSFNQRDFEGFNSVFFLRLGPAPLFNSSYFSSSLSAILLTWLNDTDRGGFRTSAGTTGCGIAVDRCPVMYDKPIRGDFDCSTLVAAPLPSLGLGSFCSWSDNRTLVVHLGIKSTFKPGDAFVFHNDSIRAGGQLSLPSSTSSSAAFLPSSSLVPPVAVLSAPPRVGTCGDLALDASLSYNNGGRAMEFAWALTAAGGTSPLTSYRTILLVLENSTSSVVVIPSSTLPLLVPMTFEVRVSSWIGLNSTAAVTVTREDMEVPMVQVFCEQTGRVKSYQVVRLYAAINISCLSNASKIGFNWYLYELHNGNVVGDLPDVRSSTSRLAIPSFSLTAGKTYRAMLSFSLQRWSSSQTYDLSVSISAPVAQIFGGSRLIPQQLDVELDGSGSYDPDLSPAGNQASATLTYLWLCRHDGIPTDNSLCNHLQFSGNLTSKLTVKAPSQLADLLQPQQAASFTFQLLVRKPSYSPGSSAQVQVIFSTSAQTLGVVLLPLAQTRINPATSLALQSSVLPSSSLPFQLQWTTEEGDVDVRNSSVLLTLAGAKSLVLRPDSLTPGASYVFRVSLLLNSSVVSYSQIAIESESRPTRGWFSVAPSSGSPLLTRFTMTCIGWTDSPDNLPLLFSFLAGNATTGFLTIAPQTVQSWRSLLLPQGSGGGSELQLGVEVENQLGVTTSSTFCELPDDPRVWEVCSVRMTTPSSSSLSTLIGRVQEAATGSLSTLTENQQTTDTLNVMFAMTSVINLLNQQAASRRSESGEVTSSLLALGAQQGFWMLARRPEGSAEEVVELDSSSSLTAEDVQSLEVLRLTMLQVVLGTVRNETLLTDTLISSLLDLVRDITAGYEQLNEQALQLTVVIVRDLLRLSARALPYQSVLSSMQAMGSTWSGVRLLFETSKLSGNASRSFQEDIETLLLDAGRNFIKDNLPGQLGSSLSSSSFQTHAQVVTFASSSSLVLAQSTFTVGDVEISMPNFEDPQGSRMTRVQTFPSGYQLEEEASVDLLAIVWTANASSVRYFERGKKGLEQQGTLLGGYWQVSARWHGYEVEANVSNLTDPLLIRASVAELPSPVYDNRTGRTENVLSCVFLDPRDYWSVLGLSVRNVSGEAVTCASRHLSVFSVKSLPYACDGVAYSPVVLDQCRVCGGNDSCVDCQGVPFGSVRRDPCGVCGGNYTLEQCLGCDGGIYLPPRSPPRKDLCGVCGGNGNDLGCDGSCFSAKSLDECGECGGDGAVCQGYGLFPEILSFFSSSSRPLPYPPLFLPLVLLLLWTVRSLFGAGTM